ncbi:MAG: Gfo/Idh/MocA family oxidoreductase [Phycisphaerae bacterium]|nr:Gfo/Idh/MocA family oxidoreductase [Phycisphaerae bacterium]
MAKKKCLMIGAGGMAASWIRWLHDDFRDRVEFAAIVDVADEPLRASADYVGLPRERRFKDVREAFEKVEADFCGICTPPRFHEEAVVLAAGRGMHILSEKPIADTWEACERIVRAVRDGGVRMQVIQNYRFTPPMLAFRQVLREGGLGRINYIMTRFAADYREPVSWGAVFRHEIPHSLLVEGAVHHFDMIRNLAGSTCRTITGWEWNVPWSSFKGECQALYAMQMANGVRAVYEGSCNAAGTQNSWYHELYRVECEGGAVAIDHDQVVRVYEHTPSVGLAIREVPPARPAFASHEYIFRAWLDWLDGGERPETVLEDNIHSAAMLFAAIRASASGAAAYPTTMTEEI